MKTRQTKQTNARFPQKTERGAALITALLVVMLAATIASYLLAQQSRALTRTARATERAQVALYAAPTLDWARAVLFENQKNGFVHRSQNWAKTIVAQPLVGAAKSNTANNANTVNTPANNNDGTTDTSNTVFASGLIRDEGGKFNLNNLVNDKQAASADDIDIFKRLLKNLKLNPNLSDAAVDWLDIDDEARPNGAEDGYYLNLASPYRTAKQPMVQWQELARVRGFDAATMRRLQPFATALPKVNKTNTKININTATIELIAAVFDISIDDAISIVSEREKAAFKTIDDIKKLEVLKKKAALVDQFATVTSDYFTVSVAISGENSSARQTALVGNTAAKQTGWPSIIWVQSE